MSAPQDRSERRRFPRIAVRSPLRAATDRPAEDVTVRDVSEGGFLVETASPFPIDAVHAFRVRRPDGTFVTMLVARCVHCRRHPDPVAPPIYLAGFAFVDPTGDTAQARIHALIDHVTSVVAVD
jgi:hypothetical protein